MSVLRKSNPTRDGSSAQDEPLTGGEQEKRQEIVMHLIERHMHICGYESDERDLDPHSNECLIRRFRNRRCKGGSEERKKEIRGEHTEVYSVSTRIELGIMPKR